MNVLATLVVFAIAMVAASWTLLFWTRRPVRVSDLMGKVDPTLAARLYPFVEQKDPSLAFNDESLLAAIGGIRGIVRMHDESGIFLSLALRIRKRYADDVGAPAREMIRNALYLRAMTWLAILEAIVSATVPSLPMVQARSCTYLYCHIAISLDVVLSVCDMPSDAKI